MVSGAKGDGHGAPGLLDVVVPVFNEAQGLGAFHERVRRVPLPLPLRLIFVDNASTDGSLAILESLEERFEDVTLIRHAHNAGYGASLRDGIAAATAPVVAILDADGEYPPEALPALYAALEHAPVVYASRFLGGGARHMPLTQRLGNRLVTGLFNLVFRQQHTDLYTGCKLMRREALRGITLERDGYEQVLELAVKLARRGVAVKDVAIAFEPRRTDRSKMRHLRESAKYVWLLGRYALTRAG
jgi:glycosyltransferase involved in cell wall biosynthesis